MIDIRESVFETNSSTSHALTICTKTLKEAMLNYEVFYIESKIVVAGESSNYEDEISVYKLLDKPECYKVRADILDELKDWLLNEKYLNDAEKIWIDKISLDTFDEFVETQSRLICNFMCDAGYIEPETMFGSNNGDTYTLWEDEYPLADENNLTLSFVSRAC